MFFTSLERSVVHNHRQRVMNAVHILGTFYMTCGTGVDDRAIGMVRTCQRVSTYPRVMNAR
jgi:hypothetical protein